MMMFFAVPIFWDGFVKSFEKVKLFYSRLPKKGPKNLEFVMVQF